MASDKAATSPTGLIYIPKPGELLHALRGYWVRFAQAALESVAAYTRPKLKDTAFFNDLYSSDHPEGKAGPEVGIDWADEDGFSVSKPIMIKSPMYANPLYEPLMKDDEESEHSFDETVGIAKEEIIQACALMSGQYGGPHATLHELLDTEEEVGGVDIVFWYYRDTDLIYSIRRVKDNYFYDFASKRFMMVPAIYRAGMPMAEPIKPSGYIYSTRLSGKLSDSEYVVTFRDTKANDVVIGIMAVFMKSGKQHELPPNGLEDTPIEPGVPMPEGAFRRAEQRVRLVDTDGPEVAQ